MAIIALPTTQSLRIVATVGPSQLASGTAVVCRAKSGMVLVTNRHNVTGRHQATGAPLSATGGVPDALQVCHNWTDGLGKWIWKTEPLFVDGRPRWVEHPTRGSKADVVALPLSNVDGVQFYPYAPLEGPAIKFGMADTVSVVGFPFGMTAGGSFAIWATGFVATEPEIDYEDMPVFLIDCRARPGQSGSAVIAHRNGGMVALEDGSTAVFGGPVTRFLGIYSGRISDQSDLGMVWKASAISELLAVA